MDYKIIAVDTAIGQLTVTFLNSAGAEVSTCAVDVPIVDGSFITGDALEQEIQQRAPVWFLERTDAISTVTNLSHLEELVDHEYVASMQIVPVRSNRITITDVLTLSTQTSRTVIDQSIDIESM